MAGAGRRRCAVDVGSPAYELDLIYVRGILPKMFPNLSILLYIFVFRGARYIKFFDT